MDDRTKWLLKQPTFWLGVLATCCMTAVAVGLVPPNGTGARVVAGILAVLNQYGVTVGHVSPPPRVPWSEQQKIDESRRRIAKGEPPLHGYEYLLGAPPSSSAPPAPPPPIQPG